MKLVWNSRRRIKCALLFASCVVFAFGDLRAQTNVWQPSPGHTQIPIWPGTAPDAEPVPGPEFAETTEKLYAGRPVVVVNNVSQPTMTVYSPKGTNTGAAVVVFPGGGYNCLAIDLEGTEVCDWLTSIGITGVLLKYRVPTLKFEGLRESRQALQDAQRTLGLVRFHAAKWNIDPHKIGVLGFSAGGHMVAATSTRYEKRLYPAVDAADKESCRPDFAIALYPGHLCTRGGNLELNPNVPVTSNTPPAFLVQAEDDPVDPVENSLVYFMALKKVGVPVEMHLYAEGGHAFGLRRTKFPVTKWPELAETWLQTIGMTSVESNSPATPAAHIQPETISPQRFHIVRKGETLSGISYKYYGSAGKWRKIFEANRGTLKDANTVRSGITLIIPD
jgi:acetyl esterase/lipase/phage tail protein X